MVINVRLFFEVEKGSTGLREDELSIGGGGHSHLQNTQTLYFLVIKIS